MDETRERVTRGPMPPVPVVDEDIPGPNWAWRRAVRSHPVWGRPYRIGVLIVGIIVVVFGLITVPLPGPGWLTVLFGVAILATEFAWAERLLERGRDLLKRWNDWIMAQSLWVRGLVVVATFALVMGTFWVIFKATGVPSYLPDFAESFLHGYAGL